MRKLKRLFAAAGAAALAFTACPVTARAAVAADYADEYGEIISGADYTIMVRLSGKYITAANDGNIHQWE